MGALSNKPLTTENHGKSGVGGQFIADPLLQAYGTYTRVVVISIVEFHS